MESMTGEKGGVGRVDWGGDFGVLGWGEKVYLRRWDPTMCATFWKSFMLDSGSDGSLCLFVDWSILRVSYHMGCGDIILHCMFGAAMAYRWIVLYVQEIRLEA